MTVVLNALNKVKTAFNKDIFFSISLLAAVVTSFFNIPNLGYIDFKIILCLFELMIIVKALEEYSLLNHISVNILNRCKNERILTQALCLISFVFSMFLTNDVAILTIIPIMIVIARKSNYNIVLPSILITISANLGSSTTPIGNPQNLYLFSFYKLNAKTFFAYSWPICAASFILLMCISFLVKPKQIQFVMNDVKVVEKKKIAVFILLSVFVLLSVFGIVNYLITFTIIILTTLFLNKNLFKKVDYRLLFTFVCFFIAVGNISNIPIIKDYLTNLTKTSAAVYLSSLLTSQIISNVPSAILLAPFTSSSHALFCGVNIGGLGTPVASLASIIAYKLFVHEYPKKSREFLIKFTLWNFISLIILGLVCFFIFI